MSTVACADCGASVPGEQADLSANGWRCRACSLRHQIDVHQGADDQIGELTIDEMEQRASKAMSFVVLSILGGLVCLALLVTGAIDGEGRRAGRARVGMFMAIPTSIAFAGYELIAWRRAKRAAAVMRSREPG
jgi:hypothetical protein